MGLTEYTRRLLGLSEAVHRWLGALAALDSQRRERVAKYADEIAATLLRAADALARLEVDLGDRAAARAFTRETGRITGYVETVIETLEHHLDGRKLAGVKRRLEQLAEPDPAAGARAGYSKAMIERLAAAEGYFRALADGLRT